MLEHDPNGQDWDDWKIQQEFFEGLARVMIRGRHDWPMPDTAPTTPPDDEELVEPDGE